MYLMKGRYIHLKFQRPLSYVLRFTRVAFGTQREVCSLAKKKEKNRVPSLEKRLRFVNNNKSFESMDHFFEVELYL